MNGKEQTLYVKYLFPFKYQQLNSASFLKSLTDIFGLGSLGGSFFSSSPFSVNRIRVLVSMPKFFIEPPLSVPVQYFPCICELLDTSPRNIFAARMTEDKLDSEVDYVGASVKVTGSRVEDVKSPVKPHNPALNHSTRSPSPSQI